MVEIIDIFGNKWIVNTKYLQVIKPVSDETRSSKNGPLLKCKYWMIVGVNYLQEIPIEEIPSFLFIQNR